ncbi:hypothetical protein L6452_02396 [Arctium lappa]|uniref:Uncharacterized protein n=1 Tax=Arctium lappa TaxID=4217 RepID=A0ACB9FKK8_ARCLA|nr:hypothetical protein L6452_02396 [Arctium lappa]
MNCKLFLNSDDMKWRRRRIGIDGALEGSSISVIRASESSCNGGRASQNCVAFFWISCMSKINPIPFSRCRTVAS